MRSKILTLKNKGHPTVGTWLERDQAQDKLIQFYLYHSGHFIKFRKF